MSILISSCLEDGSEWRESFLSIDSGLDIYCYPCSGLDLSGVEFAVIAQPHEGLLESLPNLRAIFSLWAGVESSVRVSNFPLSIPLYRMVDSSMSDSIGEYLLGHVLRHHLSMGRFSAQQDLGVWDDKFSPLLARECIVGVLGAGEIGRSVLSKFSGCGFGTACWSRSRKSILGTESFAGIGELADFLGVCDYLVSLLPDTSFTEDLLDAERFSQCKRGCYFLNVGRGKQVVDDALLGALDSGHLSGATLDVFRDEPLPEGNIFWSHPRVDVTPHIAGITRRDSGCAHILDLMGRIRAGESPTIGLYDSVRGY